MEIPVWYAIEVDGKKGRSPQGERGLKSTADFSTNTPGTVSLPARGARIEIPRNQNTCFRCVSLPARGARIEIKLPSLSITGCRRRSPQGERGLKLAPVRKIREQLRRSPQGERGLKYSAAARYVKVKVAPRKGSAD